MAGIAVADCILVQVVWKSNVAFFTPVDLNIFIAEILNGDCYCSCKN